MYVTLRRGDRLPIVAYGQWLLGQHPAVARDALSVDGIFGPHTETAVRAVRADESLPDSGEFAEPMWSILKNGIGDRRQVIESIGIGSTSSRHSIRGYDPDVLADRNHVGDGDPHVSVVIHAGSSFGLPRAFDRLLARPHGRCVLLRFHGHGAPGFMVVSGGGAPGSAFAPHRSPGYRREVARLRPLFGPFGSIELHGCRVGRGGIGLRSLEVIAEETRVPVSAAYTPQMGGAASNRFEGPVRTVFPGPMTLPSWARRQVGYRSVATL